MIPAINHRFPPRVLSEEADKETHIAGCFKKGLQDSLDSPRE